MSSFAGTRRVRAAGTVTGVKGAGRLPRAARPERTLRRPSSVPEPAHGLPIDIQRKRLVSAAIRSTDEVGYVNTSVARITSRARVSRRTFYELFADRGSCLLAAFEDVVALIKRDLAAAELDGLAWRERVRMGLWTILSFLEREPALARMCVVQSLQGDAKILAKREALLASLATIVDEGRGESGRSTQATPLTAEGLVGAALSILYTRLSREQREPLTGLLGELMGLIVLPYLGPAAAGRERTRPAPEPVPGRGARLGEDQRFAGDPFEGITMRLTYRTVCVLECVASEPGASNRRVGALAGVPDQGQISKLLGRLRRIGLVASNTGFEPALGGANAWTLTGKGERVVQSLRAHAGIRAGGGVG
ncbi:MAG TPA: TetR/AcrR family transcriptional regulator [Solirubrobacteraceae bacterium]|jgi:AcrR family transcriptional regulator|nr:TetR/AcrR family transcriptional regulator [Solirubrobacteraceae bacterium]